MTMTMTISIVIAASTSSNMGLALQSGPVSLLPPKPKLECSAQVSSRTPWGRPKAATKTRLWL